MRLPPETRPIPGVSHRHCGHRECTRSRSTWCRPCVCGEEDQRRRLLATIGGPRTWARSLLAVHRLQRRLSALCLNSGLSGETLEEGGLEEEPVQRAPPCLIGRMTFAPLGMGAFVAVQENGRVDRPARQGYLEQL
jgi:hypothetical protein